MVLTMEEVEVEEITINHFSIFSPVIIQVSVTSALKCLIILFDSVFNSSANEISVTIST